MTAKLKVVEGKPAGACIPLRDDALMIGRDPSCHLRPKHESVGEKHCKVRVVKDHVSIRDLGSESGTLVNGRKISPADSVVAFAGDLLQVGNLVFEVDIEAPPISAVSLLDEEETEVVSAAAMLANQIFQRSLGQGADPTRGAGVHLNTSLIEGIPVVAIEIANLTGDAILPFRKELRNLAMRPKLQRVVLDFHKVRAISPDAAGLLLSFQDLLLQRGGVVKLCDVDSAIMNVLEARGVLSTIPIALDAHDAIWSPW